MKHNNLIIKFFLFFLFCVNIPMFAGIDMQSHVQSDAGKAAYVLYRTKQSAYYTTGYHYADLIGLTGSSLFDKLNDLMGSTNDILQSQYNYGALRYAYVNVDKDLHTEVLERYEKLDLAPYKGFINPVMIPIMDIDCNIIDITINYNETYEHQMLRYSKYYSIL